VISPAPLPIDDDDSPIDDDESREAESLSEVELRARLKVVTKERNQLRAQLAQDEPLRPFQIELLKLQNHIEASRTPMIVLFDGRDASGKGGTIRRITRFMNEKRYRVVALGKPSKDQKTQWYFQRFVSEFPTGGEIVLFDRSWYNRALVEPVLGFCTKTQYRDFLKGVVGFEKDLVRQGTVLVKLYFSVDKGVQAQRFDRRETDPLRQWKLSEVDRQAQEYWDEFTEKKHRMLEATSSGPAPWTIIRSSSKRKARLNAMKVILNAVDYSDRNKSLDFKPDPKIVISGTDELARMDQERDELGKSVY